MVLPPASSPPSVICCGLSTLDLQLNACNVPITLEHITQFSHTTSTAGGSSPQVALALSALRLPVAVLTAIGNDTYGEALTKQLTDAAVNIDAVCVDASSCTALAVLPVFVDGRRGCFVTLGANLTATGEAFISRALNTRLFTPALRVFHFGYPHLMPNLRGRDLRSLFDRVRREVPHAVFSLDVNGADVPEAEQSVLQPALELVGFFHANLEEACIITGLANPNRADDLSLAEIKPIVQWFVHRGVILACISAGSDGCFVATADSGVRRVGVGLGQPIEAGVFLHRAAFLVGDGVTVNASGAGDAFVAGLLASLVSGVPGGVLRLVDSGLASALRRIDPTLVGHGVGIDGVLEAALQRDRIASRDSLQLGRLRGELTDVRSLQTTRL